MFENQRPTVPTLLDALHLEVVADSSLGGTDTFNSDRFIRFSGETLEPASYGRFDHESGNTRIDFVKTI